MTHVFAGGHKVDGNPYGLFVNTVADYRGRVSPAAVKGQEARIYIGNDAIATGLADRIATPDEVLAEMRQGIFKSANNPPPVRVATITINGRSADTVQPGYDESHIQAMPAQGQTEEAVGWEKAVEKTNAFYTG